MGSFTDESFRQITTQSTRTTTDTISLVVNGQELQLTHQSIQELLSKATVSDCKQHPSAAPTVQGALAQAPSAAIPSTSASSLMLRGQDSSVQISSNNDCLGLSEEVPSSRPIDRRIGVFWDIENVQVPRGKSSREVVAACRAKLMQGYREVEFMCACDVSKEREYVINGLNEASVDVVHVAATSKNAADEKIKQAMRRFVMTHCPLERVSVAIVLLSADVNFAPDLCDYRQRHGVRIILVCDGQANESLLSVAHTVFSFSELTADIPYRIPTSIQSATITTMRVLNLPMHVRRESVHARLKSLSSNCGGRVECVDGDYAVITFLSGNHAKRAAKRLSGADVFGRTVSVDIISESTTGCIPAPAYSRAIFRPIENGLTANSADRAEKDKPKPLDFDNLSNDKGLSLPPPLIPFENSTGSPLLYLPGPSNYDFGNPVVMSAAMEGPTGVVPESRMAESPDSERDGRASGTSFNGDASSGQCLTGANGGEVVTKRKVCTANGHKDWLRVQLAGKERADSEGSAGNDENEPISTSSESPVSEKGLNGEGKNGNPVNGNAKFDKKKSDSSSDDVDLGANRVVPFSPRKQNGYRRVKESPWGFNYPPPGHYDIGQNYPNLMSVRTIWNDNPNPNQGRPNGGWCGPENERRPVRGRKRNGSAPAEEQLYILNVANLESHKDVYGVRSLLKAAIVEHAPVVGVNVQHISHNSFIATVKLRTEHDKQVVISHLQRKKIGNKKILISEVPQRDESSMEAMRAQVTALLNDVPAHRLPIYKFRELYENRFKGGTITMGDLNQMLDLVLIQEDRADGRTVYLQPQHHSPRHGISNGKGNGLLHRPHGPDSAYASDWDSEHGWDGCFHPSFPYEAVCKVHADSELARSGTYAGWAERTFILPPLPEIEISLKLLGARVHSLLLTHEGRVPLASFAVCYRKQFGDKLEHSRNGVNLEHLVTCVQGVELVVSNGYKYLTWMVNDPSTRHPLAVNSFSLEDLGRRSSNSPESKPAPDSIEGLVAQFSREVVDFLKLYPRSTIPFEHFIPHFHKHFGKQLRVSDYGVTKLVDLIKSQAHVLQILGQSPYLCITLTHMAQVRRFVGDLLRVVRNQPRMRLALKDFADRYRVMNYKEFNVVDYGVCCLIDLVTGLPESVVKMEQTEDEGLVLSIPRRDKTPLENERLREFAVQARDLLKSLPHWRIAFNKFIPAFHQLFNRQCRVADYGCIKLIEVFEAISDVVEIIEFPGIPGQTSITGHPNERFVRLVEAERVKALEEHIRGLVRASKNRGVLLADVANAFARHYGYWLDPAEYGAASVDEVIANLRKVKIVESRDGPIILLVDRGPLYEVGLRLRQILADVPTGRLTIQDFMKEYVERYGRPCSIEVVRRDLFDVVTINGDHTTGTIALNPIQMFGKNVRTLVREHGGCISFTNFEHAFANRFGTPLSPSAFGHASLYNLLSAVPEYVFVKGRNGNRTICLSRDLNGPLRRDSGNSESGYAPDGKLSPLNGRQTPSPNEDHRRTPNGRRTPMGARSGSNVKFDAHSPAPAPSRGTSRRLNFSPNNDEGTANRVIERIRAVEENQIRERPAVGCGCPGACACPVQRPADVGAGAQAQGWKFVTTLVTSNGVPACPAPVTSPDPTDLPNPSSCGFL